MGGLEVVRSEDGLRRDRWGSVVQQSAFAHLGEEIEIEEMHGAQDEEDDADFVADRFEDFAGIFNHSADFEGK